jgi:hypothetical protein
LISISIEIIVRDGKGGKDRVTCLPQKLKPVLERHLSEVKAIHDRDLMTGFGRVFLPNALAEKYPNADKEWGWQYVFPARGISKDPRSATPMAATISMKQPFNPP